MKELIERLRSGPAGSFLAQEVVNEAADALERLTAELADVTSMYNRLVDDVHAARTERDLALERGAEYSEQLSKQDLKIERLTAERDALRADAERYEFLRNKFATKSENSVDDFIALEPMTGDCFDAHIDLLMEEFERAKK